MIEIARVEPKKIQRKLLTNEQKRAICRAKGYHCSKCPLELTFDDSSYCYSEVKDLEDAVQNYWNEEIKIEEECL